MGLSTVFGLVATFCAILGSMLSCTMLLARYNGSADREFPILLSEYFEVNVRRKETVVDRDQAPLVASTAQSLKSVWDSLVPLNKVLSLNKQQIEAYAKPGAADAQTTQYASLILSNGVDLGPIKEGYNIYNAGLQKLLPAPFQYDSESSTSRQQYRVLEATVGTFNVYATSNLPEAKKAALPTQAATAVVTARFKENDESFEKLRIQTRVAVASSVVSILSFSIALTVLFVEKKTYKIVFLNFAGALGGLLFLIMIQLNKETTTEFLKANGQPVLASVAGPAIFAAGFAMAAGFIGGITSALYLRVEGGSNNSDEEEISMDEIKSEEAVKADL